MQEIKYVYDEEGNKTEVVVPIKIWNELIHSKQKKHLKFSRYYGIYKNREIDPKKEAKELRDEWERT